MIWMSSSSRPSVNSNSRLRVAQAPRARIIAGSKIEHRRGGPLLPRSAAQNQNGNNPRGGKTSSEGMSKIADLYKDVWGHLPETLRQEMDQYSREQFMAKYGDLLKQYYATIAEKGRRKAEP